MSNSININDVPREHEVADSLGFVPENNTAQKSDEALTGDTAPGVPDASAVELLAPAGNMTCLHAAVRAGADAVYMGAGQFNARRGADNFTLEELTQACDYAHVRGVKVYLTLNTVVLPSELPDALELARQAYRCGVDAFIVQDIGIASEIKRTIPDVGVHASTQMNIHDADSLAAAAALGVSRVTLARELSLFEITELVQVANSLGVEVEIFAHGALCVCYSGQCFMSSMIGGRSANRGRCAQACRLPYTLHNRALHKSLPSPGEHLLSPKDLCTASILPQVVATGVRSLKVEGRMKSPEYVAAVVGVYRELLDTLQTTGSVEPTSEQLQTLAEAFTRGFTTAYLEEERGNEIMSYGRPNNRGVRVGRVVSAANNVVTVDDEGQLEAGDLIEFWTNRGHFIHDITQINRNKQGFAQLTGVDRAVGKGDRVFRVRSARNAFVDNENEPRVPITGVARLHIGQPAQLEFTVANNGEACASAREAITVCVEGAVVEPARTKAISAEDVQAHINRMGQTPFAIAQLDVELDDGVGMGFSALHALRAQAANELQQAILTPYHERELSKTPSRTPLVRARAKGCEIMALVTNPACARAAKKAGAQALYVPEQNYHRGEAVIAGQLSQTAEQAGYPKQCICVLPPVSHMHDEEKRNGYDIYKRVKAGAPVLCENMGQVVHALEVGACVEVGPHIPVTNELDVRLLDAMGVSRIWLSPELSLMQIEELGQLSPVPLGITIMGKQELMVTEHCLLMSQGPCNEDCPHCARRRSPHYLTDRKGYEMPVVTDCCGRSHLYNAVELDIAYQMPELIAAGVSACMVDTTLMNVQETSKAVARAVRARDIARKSGDRVSKKPDTTSGHLFRGVS